MSNQQGKDLREKLKALEVVVMRHGEPCSFTIAQPDYQVDAILALFTKAQQQMLAELKGKAVEVELANDATQEMVNIDAVPVSVIDKKSEDLKEVTNG